MKRHGWESEGHNLGICYNISYGCDIHSPSKETGQNILNQILKGEFELPSLHRNWQVESFSYAQGIEDLTLSPEQRQGGAWNPSWARREEDVVGPEGWHGYTRPDEWASVRQPVLCILSEHWHSYPASTYFLFWMYFYRVQVLKKGRFHRKSRGLISSTCLLCFKLHEDQKGLEGSLSLSTKQNNNLKPPFLKYIVQFLQISTEGAPATVQPQFSLCLGNLRPSQM
jgi:hypothetical protein